MINIISNGRKWAGESPDSIDKLFDVLKNHPLERYFRRYSYKVGNRISFFGNFQTISHVFRITTDEKWLINKMRRFITANKKRKDY